MNEETKKYEPTLEDLFFVIPSGDYQRLVFTNHELRERETKHTEDFRKFLGEKNLSLPAGYDDDKRLMLRFLQKMKWDYQKSYDAIMENDAWRKGVNVSNIEPLMKDLNAGWLYAYKRDKSMRPVIIVSVRRIIDSRVTIEHLVTVTDFFLHYVIENGMVPGKIENWTAIFDMRDVGVTELPSSHI